MESRKLLSQKKSLVGNLREKRRLLAVYAGIFPDNIQEFASRFIKRNKPIKNYSR